MKTALIIPIYNQSKYFLRLVSAIENMTILPDVVYPVLDRNSERDISEINKILSNPKLKCKYNVLSISSIPEYIGKPTNNPDQDLFLTGDRRNQAIDVAINDGCDVFVFIDGDCIPEKDLVCAHNRVNSRGLPNLSAGRRREEKHNWLDQREVDGKLKALRLFSKTNEIVIHNPELLYTATVVWSCNISLNLSAIKLLKKLNEYYYGRSEVFNSEFLGAWGGEDVFLGIQAYMARIFITIINDEFGGVRHIEHPRPLNKYHVKAWTEHLGEQVELLNLMQTNKPLDLSFF